VPDSSATTPEQKPRKASKSFTREVKSGMAWTVIGRGGVQFFNLLSSVVLARLLSPSDFGVLGLSVLFTGVSGRASNLSFGMAIVQRDTIRPDHLATLFATMLAVNGAVFVSLVSISPWVGEYFGNPLIGHVLAVSSLNFLIRCIGVCPSAMLRRSMSFKVLSTGTILDAFFNLLLAMSLALLGFGVWSLVWAGLTAGLLSKLYLVKASGWRPSLRASRAAFKELFGFGMGVSISELITYAADRTGNFVIGKTMGTTALGYYDKAHSLMSLPARELGTRVNRVLFPVFARIHRESSRFRAAMRKTVLSLSLVGYPVFGSLIVLAPEVVAVMYGDQWTGAVLPFQILCLMSLPKLMVDVMVAAIFATGSASHEVKRRMGIAALVVVGSLVGARWGIAGVATALVIANVCGLITVLWRLRHLKLLEPFTDVVRPQRIPFVGGLALIGAERACQVWTQGLGIGAFGVLAVSLIVGSAVYLVVVAVLKDKLLSRLLIELKGDVVPIVARMPMSVALMRRLRS